MQPAYSLLSSLLESTLLHARLKSKNICGLPVFLNTFLTANGWSVADGFLVLDALDRFMERLLDAAIMIFNNTNRSFINAVGSAQACKASISSNIFTVCVGVKTLVKQATLLNSAASPESC